MVTWLKNCSSNYIFRKCNGKHHVSVCRKEDSSCQVAHVDTSGSILLQAAKGELCDIGEIKSITTRILLVSGIQRTYINSDLKEKLKLGTLRSEKVVIKTF